MQHDATKREISITELERELQVEEVFDELEHATTREMPAVSPIDEETTSIHEIRPSQLATWAFGSGQVYWVALAR